MQGIPDAARIDDTREASDFRGMSFSGFKMGAVVKKLQQAYGDRGIEDACFWSAELLCAGHYAKLWEIVSLAAANRHATASPRVPILIAMHFEAFKALVQSGYDGRELELRNNPSIRSMFAEMAAVLCTAKRQHPIPPVRIKPATDFDLAAMAGRLEAPSTSFAQGVFGDGDPQELFVAVNELCYQLDAKQSNSVSACYWVEWIAAFSKHCASKGTRMRVRPRTFAPVGDAMQSDPIWIVWEAVLTHGRRRGPQAARALDALLSLYSIRYTPGCRARRSPLLYAAVTLATVSVDFSVPAASDPAAIANIVARAVVAPYRDIKKREVVAAGSAAAAGRTNRQNTSARLQRLDAILAAAPQRRQ